MFESEGKTQEEGEGGTHKDKMRGFGRGRASRDSLWLIDCSSAKQNTTEGRGKKILGQTENEQNEAFNIIVVIVIISHEFYVVFLCAGKTLSVHCLIFLLKR